MVVLVLVAAHRLVSQCGLDVMQHLTSVWHPARDMDFLLLAGGSLNTVILIDANRPWRPTLPTVLEVPSMLMNYLSYLEAEGFTVLCEGILAVLRLDCLDSGENYFLAYMWEILGPN